MTPIALGVLVGSLSEAASCHMLPVKSFAVDFSCCFVSSWYANVYTRYEMTDKMREEKEQLDLVMGKILRIGILLSLLLCSLV